MVHRLEREQLVEASRDELFAFYSHARNLEALTPPWLRFEVLTPEPIEMRPGTLIEYRLRLHGLRLRWVTRIEEWEPDRRFVDRQLRGPYRLWRHLHEFDARPEGTLVRDTVDYALALGPLGELAHGAFVRRDLDRIFDFRRDRIAGRLAAAVLAGR